MSSTRTADFILADELSISGTRSAGGFRGASEDLRINDVCRRSALEHLRHSSAHHVKYGLRGSNRKAHCMRTAQHVGVAEDGMRSGSSSDRIHTQAHSRTLA